MKKIKLLFCTVVGSAFIHAQIGIGTNTVIPDKSSILDIQSTTKGMLAPRMTTVQRVAIANPAESLLVYDTDLKNFFTYSSGAWKELGGFGSTNRINYKLVKSTGDLASELTSGGNTTYKLNANTLYEINGTVQLDFPIDLNNAYVTGIDSGDDKLVFPTGTVFKGNTGGTIKGLTLRGNKVFEITGTASENLIFRDCIVANSGSVGTISNLGMVFISVVQFSGNTTGITYNAISQLLISNVGWFGNNQGTFEKLTGTFGLVQKQGGFSDVNGTAIGFDASDQNLAVSGDAILESVVFTGNNTAGYVKGNTNGTTFTNYNFNNSWNVRSAGIPTETDASASGEFGVDFAVGNGHPISITNETSLYKIAPTSVSSNLFRFTTNNNSRLTYVGKKKRIFQISGSISFQVPAAGTYIVYIVKNATTNIMNLPYSSGTVVLTQNKVYGRGTTTSDIVVLPLNASTELKTNEYIEVYIQRYSGTNGTVLIPNMTLTIK